MSNLDERWLWAGDFVISGIGWFVGGTYAALLCFSVARLLIFIALNKEQDHSKHRILIDEHTAYYYCVIK